jgi:hypothetical protein
VRARGHGGNELNLDLSGSPSGPRAFGPFKVLHQIGIGVLGPVFRAQDREHLVAIKTFRLDVPPEAAAEIGNALKALVAFAPRIPGLVTPVGAGVEGETPWLAMPHVALPTLDTRLRDEGAPPIDRALRLVGAIAEAIDAAHAQDLLHGSLHPRDVFVAADGRVQMTGFGVARVLWSVGVRPPVRRPYSAPELVTDASPAGLAPPADHYALGTMAFELLTGHRLLTSGADLAERLSRADGTPIKDAATALAAMLAERPEHRPSHAATFARALSQALGYAFEPRESLPAGADPHPKAATADDEGVSDEALQLFARQGTLWEPRTEPVRDAWPAAAATVNEAPTLVALEPQPAIAPEAAAFAEDVVAVAQTRHVAAAPEPPVRFIAPDPPPAPSRGHAMEVDLPAPAPPAVMRASAPDPDAAGSPPGVVIALVLALGLAIGGAGGYLLGQRSGMRAAIRAQGGAPAISEDQRPLAEAAPEPEPEPAPAPAEPPASVPSEPVDPRRSSPADGGASPAAPAAAPPARERPAPVEGHILVRSTPARAGVLVNGVWKGRTPLTVTHLPLGTHAVRVVQDGHVAETRRVTLDARVPSATVSLQLERLAPTRPAAAAPPPPPRPAATTGGLYLESRPKSARVFLDQRLVGTTPLLIGELQPGAHDVRIEHPGYRSWSTTVKISAGQRTRVAASLEEGSEPPRP